MVSNSIACASAPIDATVDGPTLERGVAHERPPPGDAGDRHLDHQPLRRFAMSDGGELTDERWDVIAPSMPRLVEWLVSRDRRASRSHHVMVR